MSFWLRQSNTKAWVRFSTTAHGDGGKGIGKSISPCAEAAASASGNWSAALWRCRVPSSAQLLCPFPAPCTDFLPDGLLSLRHEQQLSFYSERSSHFQALSQHRKYVLQTTELCRDARACCWLMHDLRKAHITVPHHSVLLCEMVTVLRRAHGT